MHAWVLDGLEVEQQRRLSLVALELLIEIIWAMRPVILASRCVWAARIGDLTTQTLSAINRHTWFNVAIEVCALSRSSTTISLAANKGL